MREDIAPFELHEIDGKPTLQLHGTEGKHIVVEEDKIQLILDAIFCGWHIDIQYTIIDGDLDISSIAENLEKDDKGRPIIQSSILIYCSEINGNIDFHLAAFNDKVTFMLTTFNGVAIFESTEFNGEVNYSYSKFNNKAVFSLATFNSGVDFQSATFNDEAYFWSVTFNDIAFFQLAKFNGYSGFMSATFDGVALFNYVRFGKNVDLSCANLDNITPESFDSIGDAYVSSSIRGSHYFFQMAGEGHWDNAHYLEASNSFRNAKMAYEKEGIYDQASSMYIKEKNSIRLDMKINKGSPLRYIWLTVWKYTSNYGENPLWFIGWVAAIVLVFAIIYMPVMPDWWPSITFKEYPYHDWNSGIVDGAFFNIVTAIYFSIVTFATLGFGDISPISITGKIATISEVLLGYMMFSTLITLVARKMTRS